MARAMGELVGGVEHLYRSALRDGLRRGALLGVQRQQLASQTLVELRPDSSTGHEAEALVLAEKEQSERPITEAGCVLENRIEYGSVVVRRPVNDPQDLTGRGFAGPRITELLCEICHVFPSGIHHRKRAYHTGFGAPSQSVATARCPVPDEFEIQFTPDTGANRIMKLAERWFERTLISDEITLIRKFWGQYT